MPKQGRYIRFDSSASEVAKTRFFRNCYNIFTRPFTHSSEAIYSKCRILPWLYLIHTLSMYIIRYFLANILYFFVRAKKYCQKARPSVFRVEFSSLIFCKQDLLSQTLSKEQTSVCFSMYSLIKLKSQNTRGLLFSRYA